MGTKKDEAQKLCLSNLQELRLFLKFEFPYFKMPSQIGIAAKITT